VSSEGKNKMDEGDAYVSLGYNAQPFNRDMCRFGIHVSLAYLDVESELNERWVGVRRTSSGSSGPS